MRSCATVGLSTLLLSNLITTGTAHASAQACFNASERDFSEALACYKKEQDTQPLQYLPNGKSAFEGVEKRSFKLTSQRWSPQGLVTPDQWQHEVDIYIPDDALHGQALLVANNGTAFGQDNAAASGATDFSQDMALKVARETRTIVISVSNIPSQYLTYTDDDVARKEDASVAHSWKLFLEAPHERPFMSVRLPMVVSMVKAMDMAQRELAPWGIEQFILSGASKRGWTAWLTAVADQRVAAIVPFAIDILNMDKVLEHTYRAYAEHWPLAFHAYQHEGITRQIETENFSRLLKVEDPLSYLDSAYSERLAIPKYIVNASSDDFFLPDNAGFFLDRLPGPTALRVAPNSSHYGIKGFVEHSLIQVINRWRQNRPLPTITMQADAQGGPGAVQLQFSEAPVRVTQWTAVNPQARDFRHPCGIRYEAKPLRLMEPLAATVHISPPPQGWSATFVEATFGDGFVATTPVQVLPDRYPDQPPPAIAPACKTLSDRSAS